MRRWSGLWKGSKNACNGAVSAINRVGGWSCVLGLVLRLWRVCGGLSGKRKGLCLAQVRRLRKRVVRCRGGFYAFALAGRADNVGDTTQGVALGYELLPLRGVWVRKWVGESGLFDFFE